MKKVHKWKEQKNEIDIRWIKSTCKNFIWKAKWAGSQKNIMRKQEREKCEDDWSFHPSTELKSTEDAYYALSRLVKKIKNNISIGVK